MIITWTPSQYEAVNNMYIDSQLVIGGYGVTLGLGLIPTICTTQTLSFNSEDKSLTFNLRCL